jgi:hypothetical protein
LLGSFEYLLLQTLVRNQMTTKNEKGQSLFEVVLALGVITAITIGIVSLAAGSIRNASFSKNKTLAGRYAQEATEWLRGQRDADFDAFSTYVSDNTTYCLKSLSWAVNRNCSGDSDKIADTPLFREVLFSTDPISGKTVIEADIRVYWTDAQGAHEVRSATSFTDWRQR